jgi:site-specific DNA recombinase
MRIGIDARGSTQRQAQADGIAQQIDRLQAHALQQGWTVAAEPIFRDDGSSGARLTRPGLERLRDSAALHELDRVLIPAPDRLARNDVHQGLLLEEITAPGGQVAFLDRPMSQDPHDQLLRQIRGAVAEYERSLIVERMRRGRLRKLQAGILLPWTRPPYGDRVDPDRPGDPAGVRTDTAQAAVVAEMSAWYADEARSLFGLATKLQRDRVAPPGGRGYWSLSTLYGILTNPVDPGQVDAGRVQAGSRHVRPRAEWIAVAPVPAIVPQELVDRVPTKLGQNKQFARRHNTAHADRLRALVSCGVCGLACFGRGMPTGYRYDSCRGKPAAFDSHRATRCPARYIPAERLDAVVWEDLCQLLTHPEALQFALERAHGEHWLPQDLQARRAVLRRGHSRLQQQIERLTEADLAGVLSLEEYRRRRPDLERAQQALDAQAAQLEAQVDRQAAIKRLGLSVEDFCRRVRDGLEQATWEQKRQLVEWLVARVIVTNGEVEIRYVIPTTPDKEAKRFCQLCSDYRVGDQPAETSDRRCVALTDGAASRH